MPAKKTSSEHKRELRRLSAQRYRLKHANDPEWKRKKAEAYKRWVLAHPRDPEKHRLYSAKYYQTHGEQVREASREYYRDNREDVLLRVNEYNHSKKGNSSPTFISGFASLKAL